MEEGSEKRRERLQSIRAQAAAGASPGPVPPPSSQLSNPLILPPPVSSPASAQRFDYYTDPMSAFSGNKRRDSGGHYPGPRPTRPRGYSPSTPQYHMNRSPTQDFYQMPFPEHNSWRSPVQFGNPHSGHTGGQFYSHHDINASVKSSGPGGFRTPMITGVRSPHPGRFSSNHSPGMSSGRGRRGPRWSGGRRLGYYSGSTSQEQESFYQKSMVEDPWKDLKPVVGNILVPRAGRDFWLPKSVASKKSSVSETANKFKTEASLAEYLALSLEETVNDDTVA